MSKVVASSLNHISKLVSYDSCVLSNFMENFTPFLLVAYKWLKKENKNDHRVEFGESGLVAAQLGLITEGLK